MRIAHEYLMTEHLDVKKTVKRVLAEFHLITGGHKTFLSTMCHMSNDDTQGHLII